MKRFFNFFTVVMLIIFLGGLVTTAVLGNWLAFVWVIIGTLQMLIAREHQMVRDRLADDYEAQLQEVRHLNSELEKKYEAKLKENLELGTATVVEKRNVHGNIKLKRKKQAVQETDTDIQDNA